MKVLATACKDGSVRWCILFAVALAACSSNGSSTPSSTSSTNCNTGTQLLLFFPQPGSRVVASAGSIYVVSNGAIFNEAALGARADNAKPGSKLTSHDLAGPVGPPTPTPAPSGHPSPTPFPTPPFGANNVYYEATRFHLRPNTQYKVWVATGAEGCVPHALRGAIFSTERRF